MVGLAAILYCHQLHWHEGDAMLLNLRAAWNETEALIDRNGIQAGVDREPPAVSCPKRSLLDAQP